MLTIPTDLLCGEAGPVLQTSTASVVAYQAKASAEAFAVLVTQPTLVHVRRGTKFLPPLNGRDPLVVREGHMVLIPTGMQYMSEVLPVEGMYESTVISFDLSFLARILPDVTNTDDNRWTNGCVIDPLPAIEPMVNALPDCMSDELGARLLELKLEEIAIRLARQAPACMRILADGVRVGHGDARLQEAMQHHFHQPLQLNEFAMLSGLSLSTFKREFKLLFGTSPGRWLINKRLTYATQLLGSHHTTVTEACMACGFGDLSHFIRSFKSMYGVSPKKWQIQRLADTSHVKTS